MPEELLPPSPKFQLLDTVPHELGTEEPVKVTGVPRHTAVSLVVKDTVGAS